MLKSLNMIPLIQNLLAGDFCGMLLPLLLLAIVGQQTIQGHPHLERLSYLLGWVALLIFVSAGLLIRPQPDGSDLLVVLICGLVFAGYLVTSSWLVMPLLALISNATLIGPWRSLSQLAKRALVAWQGRRAERQQRTQDERTQRQAESDRTHHDRRANLKRQVQKAQADQQRRNQTVRDQLRYRLQLTYDQHRVELAQKFPPDQFAAYFERFLTNQLGPDEYARRAGQLEQMLVDQLGLPARRRRPKFESIDQVIAHFEAEKERIRQIPTLDEDSRETLLIVIDDAQDLAIQELLR
ncbi:MAG: hypothetical protein KDA93_20200 [Planctomycetaceae bacterium]|nr:hypothetical protein [Planctomycetaceae bacterium]